MLEIRLHHAFPGFVLNAEFSAPAWGVTAVFGPSGCGKSTLLAGIAGLLRPDAGFVSLDGSVLLDSARGVFVPAERRRCGVVFQDARLFPHLSVATNLRYGARRARAGPGPAFDEVVELLGIAQLLPRRPRTLSGGERQRVALGRALLSRPQLLLLDEPLAALDTPRRAEVLPFLARVRERFAIPMLYVTHALDEVDRLADALVLMENGRVLASGPIEEVSLRTDLPLAARRDAGAVLRCTVLAHDASRGLTQLGFAGGRLAVPLQEAGEGAQLRVRIRSRDVAIATIRPEGLSVQNVLPATIDAITRGQAYEAVVRLRVGESALLSRVTEDTVARLGLRPGQSVWALIKAVSFGDDRQQREA